MADLVSYLAATIAFVAAAGRFRSIRPARLTPAQRHLLIALVAIAPALALAVPATQVATAPIDPFPYATQLLSNALAMLAAYSVLAMLAYVIDDPVNAPVRARWHATTLLIGIVIMAALLLISDADFHDDFASASAHHWPLIAYQVVFLGYVGYNTTRFILLMRRYLSRPETRPLMRRGMLVVVLAAVVGLVWLVWNILTIAVTHAGGQIVGSPELVAGVLGAVAATLMALGSTLPTWGTWLRGTIYRRRIRNALRDLTPLWRLLATVLPQVMLREADLTDPDVTLYRRIIEIRDAQLKLMRYVPPGLNAQVLTASANRRLDRIAIQAEAAALATAIDAYRAGRRQPIESIPITYPSSSDPDVLAEARWLIRVYAALRNDSTVARIARDARRRS